MKNFITDRMILGIVGAVIFGIMPTARGQYWTEDTAFTPAIEIVATQQGGGPLFAAYPGGKLLTTGTIINGRVIAGQKMVRLNSDGALDPSFSGPAADKVLAVYPDGRILIGTGLQSGYPVVQVQRLLADGSVDPNFVAISANDTASALVLNDGRILIYGHFTIIGGVIKRGVALLAANGAVDDSFQSPLPPYLNEYVDAAKPTADGQHIIIAGGVFNLGAGLNYIARLNMNGSVDQTFNAATVSFSGNPSQVYPDAQGGGVLVADTAGNVFHLTSAGAVAAGFTPALVGSNRIFGPQQTDGKIYYLSHSIGNYNVQQLHRMNPDGSDDAAFFVPYWTYDARMPALNDDGTIVVGPVTSDRLAAGLQLTRILANGSIDPSFNPRFGTFGSVNTHAVQSDGKYLIAGIFDYINNVPMAQPYNFVRLNADATLDTSFQSSLPSPSSISRLAILPNGKILVEYFSGWTVRLGSDGSNDASYTPINQNLYAVAFGLTGDVYGYAGNTNSRLLRFTPDGMLDPAFQAPDLGILSFTTPLTNGAVLVVSSKSYSQFSLVRLLPNGTIDPNFAAPNVSRVVAMAALPDGNALICEEKYGYQPVGSFYHVITRLLPDGTSDYSYASHVTPGSGPRQDIRLAMAGALFDLLRDAAPGANASVAADFLQSEEQMALSCSTDGQLIMQSNQSGDIPFRRYQRSTLTSPSLDAAPFIIAPPAQSPSLIPLNYPFLNLSVTAGGLSPVYQWLKDGVPMAGQTSSVFSFSPFNVTDAGSYSVKVSNAYGSVTSAPITLTADAANSCAAIVTQPSNQTIGLGGAATFAVVASGNLALYYQWMFNDIPIDGATGSTLSLDKVQPANSGNYSVQVYNFVSNTSGVFIGSATSATAELTVVVPPTDAVISITVE